MSTHFHPGPLVFDDERGAARRGLRLAMTGLYGDGRTAEAVVRNLSPQGALIETAAELAEGDAIVLGAPLLGQWDAEVAWAQGPLFGCRFVVPLSAATVAAARLAGERIAEPDDVHEAEAFGERLHRLRTERGMSLADVADRLGVSKPTVWAWEHGKARPVERRLGALAAALGVTPAGLEPGPANAPQSVDAARRAVAQAYGVDPARVRIMIDL